MLSSKIVLNGSGTKIWGTIRPPKCSLRGENCLDNIDPHMFWHIVGTSTFLLYGQLDTHKHDWIPL